jgi:hypothetical protein
MIRLLRKVFYRVHVISDFTLIMMAAGLLVVFLLKFPVVLQGFSAQLHHCEFEFVSDGFGQILDNIKFCEKSIRVRLCNAGVVKNVLKQQNLPKLSSL